MHRKLVKIENNTNNCNLEINIRKKNRNKHNPEMNTVTYISFALGFPVKFQNIYGTIIDKSYFFFFCSVVCVDC